MIQIESIMMVSMELNMIDPICGLTIRPENIAMLMHRVVQIGADHDGKCSYAAEDVDCGSIMNRCK